MSQVEVFDVSAYHIFVNVIAPSARFAQANKAERWSDSETLRILILSFSTQKLGTQW